VTPCHHLYTICTPCAHDALFGGRYSQGMKTNPSQVVAGLNEADIRYRLEQLAAEEKALRVLLRAVLARKRGVDRDTDRTERRPKDEPPNH